MANQSISLDIINQLIKRFSVVLYRIIYIDITLPIGNILLK